MRLKKREILLIAALLMLFGGLFLKSLVMTDFGKIKVDQVRINAVNEKGETGVLQGRIFVPDSATPETPAPAILLCPGGNAPMENMDDLALEFARRGYVALDFDPFTIGRSDNITIGTDAGSVSAYEYLCNLPFVDASATGAGGHSAGVGRIKAMAVDEDWNSTGPLAVLNFAASTDYAPETRLHIGYTVAKWDTTRKTPPVNDVAHILQVMGLEPGDTYELGKWYYNDEGYGRIAYTASTWHSATLLTPAMVRYALDFFMETVPGHNGLSSSSLIYFWTEVLSAIAFLGVFLLIFPVADYIFSFPFFKTVNKSVPEPAGVVDWQFVFYLLLPGIISGFIAPWMVFNGQNFLNHVPFFDATNTNGMIFWFMGNSLITLVILTLRMRFDPRVDPLRLKTHLKIQVRQVFKAMLAAFLSIFSLYMVCLLTESLFKGNAPRLWKIQLNTFTVPRIGYFLCYIPLYIATNLVGGYSQTLGLRIKGAPEWTFTLLTWFSISLGPMIFLIRVYGTLFLGRPTLIQNAQMSRANGSMFNLMFCFLFVPWITTHFYKKTGSFYTGAFINSFLLCWTALATELLRV